MRRKLLAVLVASTMALGGACGGGGGGDEDGSGETTETTVAEDEAEEDDDASSEEESDFECPVTVEDVEEAFPPVQMQDPTNDGGNDCTFLREDNIGSVVVTVTDEDGRATYARAQAMMPGGEEVDLGDEAFFSLGRATLVVRKGEKVLQVMSISMLGLEGGESDPAIPVKRGAIALGTKAVANL